MFDKEDPLAVDFVTAASNLRSAAYGIPMQSLFDTKVSIRYSCALTLYLCKFVFKLNTTLTQIMGCVDGCH